MSDTKLVVCIGLLIMVTAPKVNGQNSLEGFSLSEDVLSWYDNQVGLHNTVLQNGERFDFTKKSAVSHAYYRQDSWVDMDITYSDQLFPHVPALYNVEEDFLIIRNPLDVASPIKLTRKQVSSFDVGEDRFVFIEEQVGYRSEGYYKLLYDGSELVLVGKIYKKLEIVSGTLTFVLNYDYFLKKEGDYHQIRRFSRLKKLFPTYKDELKEFKQELSLRGRYNEKSEKKLARLIEYCAALAKE